MKFIELYITKNPMRVEAKRSFRKFVGMGKLTRRAVSQGAVILTTMYVVVLAISFYLAQYLSPLVVFNIELVFLLLTSAIGFYASVSGERERRTWDVLRALPITGGQIVGGKFLGGAAVVGLVWLSFLPFNLFDALVYNRPADYGVAMPSVYATIHSEFDSTRLIQWALESLVVLFASLFALSFTILISARVRRSVSALGITLGSLFVWLAIFPTLVGTLLSFDRSGTLLTEVTGNPFSMIQLIDRFRGHSIDPFENVYIAPSAIVADCLVYLAVLVGLTLALVTWAERTLTFAEDQVDFIAKKKDAGS